MIIFILIIPSSVYAIGDIVSSQMEALNISSFIREGEMYTREVFPDMNASELLGSAITGRLDTGGIVNGLLNLFARELMESLTIIGSILAVIVIHSILKSITENMGNEGVSEIAYYIQYILIVALIMYSFSGIIVSIRDTISALTRTIKYVNPYTTGLNACDSVTLPRLHC